MHLLLWRHAEAEDGADDMKRRLTIRGHKQAQAVADWIKTFGPKHLRIVASPAARAQETAAALDLPFVTDDTIGPGASAEDLLAACGWPGADADVGDVVLLVGHQPALGELAARLLSGSEAPWTIKKGALWWFSNRHRGWESKSVLRAVIGPEICA